jgi:hypothetical protein
MHIPSAHHLAAVDGRKDESGRVRHLLSAGRRGSARIGIVLPRRILVGLEPAQLAKEGSAAARFAIFHANAEVVAVLRRCRRWRVWARQRADAVSPRSSVSRNEARLLFGATNDDQIRQPAPLG